MLGVAGVNSDQADASSKKLEALEKDFVRMQSDKAAIEQQLADQYAVARTLHESNSVLQARVKELQARRTHLPLRKGAEVLHESVSPRFTPPQQKEE